MSKFKICQPCTKVWVGTSRALPSLPVTKRWTCSRGRQRLEITQFGLRLTCWIISLRMFESFLDRYPTLLFLEVQAPLALPQELLAARNGPMSHGSCGLRSEMFYRLFYIVFVHCYSKSLGHGWSIGKWLLSSCRDSNVFLSCLTWNDRFATFVAQDSPYALASGVARECFHIIIHNIIQPYNI